eukprot:jgi/Mesen1/7064/ME000369S06389
MMSHLLCGKLGRGQRVIRYFLGSSLDTLPHFANKEPLIIDSRHRSWQVRYQGNLTNTATSKLTSGTSRAHLSIYSDVVSRNVSREEPAPDGEDESDEDEEYAHAAGSGAGFGARIHRGERRSVETLKRAPILKYLQSVDIDMDQFEDLDLPESLEIVKERLEFLRNFGVDVAQVVNDFPPLVGCSVARNFIPVLTYLENIPIRKENLPTLVSRYPRVLYSSVIVDLMPIIDYLMGLGISRSALEAVILRSPEVLGFKLEGTMSTSVNFMVSLGVGLRSVGPILTRAPEIMGMRVGNNLLPKVEYLMSLGITKAQTAAIIETNGNILTLSLERQIKPAVESILRVGVQPDQLSEVVIRYPDILTFKVEDKLPPMAAWLKSSFMLEDEDVASIFAAYPRIVDVDTTLAQRKVVFLNASGFTSEDVKTLVLGCPKVLHMSIEQTLRPKIQFLLRNMSRSLHDVVIYPTYFALDLAFISRRAKIVKATGIQCSLAWMLDCDDQKFQDRTTVDFSEGPVR